MFSFGWRDNLPRIEHWHFWTGARLNQGGDLQGGAGVQSRVQTRRLHHQRQPRCRPRSWPSHSTTTWRGQACNILPWIFLAKFVFQIVRIDNPTRLGWEWCTVWQLRVCSLPGNLRKAEVTDEVQISGKVSFSREHFRFESPSNSDFKNFSWMK